MRSLLVRNGDIVDESGEKVLLHGVNLGGWLMMEGYILGGRNIPEHMFRRYFRQKHRASGEQKFITLFRDSFITREDFKTIRKLGFNCVRIPFHYRIITEKKSSGLRCLDRALAWCEEAGLYAILDMHAAPGSQNADWHSDSSGRADFWENDRHRLLTGVLWARIAERYKKYSCIAGYDILNEPVTDKRGMLNTLYEKVVNAIRLTGDMHIIFMEGNRWGQEIDFLPVFRDTNIVYSIHFYQPLGHAFNFEMGQRYPGKIASVRWDKAKLAQCLNQYVQFQKKRNVPLYVGEFGINTRCYHCGYELKLLRDTLALFKRYAWHWTYWTYKAVAGGTHPNGIFQFLENPEWVNRQGPVYGWETYPGMDRSSVYKIPRYLNTRNFVKHEKLAKLLTYFA